MNTIACNKEREFNDILWDTNAMVWVFNGMV